MKATALPAALNRNIDPVTIARATRRASEVAARAVLLVLVTAIALLLFWGTTHGGHFLAGPRATEATEVGPPSSEQFLSQLRTENAAVMAPYLASATVDSSSITVASSPSAQTDLHH
jgi:hypothetical protein